MALFQGKYRIESARLKGFDYSSPGSYFVTIDTEGMIWWFGDVANGQMKLSQIGEIVAEEWLKTPTIRPTVTLDEWRVMPNHMHGIIMIHESKSAASSGQIPFVDWEKSFVVPIVETTDPVVSTGMTPAGKPKPKLKPNSLGSILGQFKSKCTSRIHDEGFADFQWQERFHDRIIRDEGELDRIRQYIIDNPLNWETDSRKARKWKTRRFE